MAPFSTRNSNVGATGLGSTSGVVLHHHYRQRSSPTMICPTTWASWGCGWTYHSRAWPVVVVMVEYAPPKVEPNPVAPTLEVLWGSFKSLSLWILNFIFLCFTGKAQWLHLVQELPTLALLDQAPPVGAYSTITTAIGRARLWYVQPHPQLVQVAVIDRKSTMLPILTVQAVSPMLATSIMFQAVAMGVEGILVMAIQTRNSYVRLLTCIF